MTGHKDNKELLFSLTASDFEWTYFRGSGAGGQHRNKTSSAVRVVHPPSGAKGESQEERSQYLNRRTALRRLTETPAFKAWVAAVSRGLKTPLEIEKEVEDSIADPKNIKTEIRVRKDEWKEVDPSELK